jgi:hypothetical protein
MTRWVRCIVMCATLGVSAAAVAQNAAVSPSLSASLSADKADGAPLGDKPRGSSGVVWKSFHDSGYKVSFQYPANWTFARKDGEISTFHLDARSAVHKTSLRAVTAIPENPFPDSTFSGAYVYLSVTPHSDVDSCARQAGPPVADGAVLVSKPAVSEIAGVSFAHGHDEQKHICTTDRDEVYTTYRRGACFRFDLAMNNFCGGAVSGVKDVSKQELDDVRTRLEAILGTVRFDSK